MNNLQNNTFFFISLVLILLLPIIGFIINGLFGKKINNIKISGIIGTSFVVIPFILSVVLFYLYNTNNYQPIIINLFKWIELYSYSINISYQVDNLTLIYVMMITGVGSLIHIYSTGYMHHDNSFHRFFAYLNLFIFMMLNLVASSNFLLTFLGWEGVGLSSYLLIGYWYDRNFSGYNIKITSDAANKAFIVNRIGDFGFLVAIFFIFITFNTFDYSKISELAFQNNSTYYNSTIAFLISFFLFIACSGKSAQLPLSVWLPDAMAGPTPVSALIHAATMVTAGIFLFARNSILFAMSDITMSIVTIVGISTALYGAFTAITQNDIKKVLAYSTVSQLGFMFASLGVGAYSAAVFHVVSHAFFKGLLFLGAGSVIHGMHEEQNILKMGNLKKYMPITYLTFLIATLAISGIPFFSGFFSKDEILWSVYSKGNIYYWALLLIASLTTALYMFRLLFLVFFGKERFDNEKLHPKESPKSMTIPLIFLAVLSTFGGFIAIPYSLGFWICKTPNLFEQFLNPIFYKTLKFSHSLHHHSVQTLEYILMLITISLVIVVILIAKKLFKDKEYSQNIKLEKQFFYKLSLNKFYLDEFFQLSIINPLIQLSEKVLHFIDTKIIDAFLHFISNKTIEFAEKIKKIQTGILQDYLLNLSISIFIILLVIILFFT